MLWPADYLFETYGNIRRTALEQGGCTVIIYVALDCDALCACRILTGLLKSDNIAYKIRPVRFQEDVVEDFKVTSAQEDIKSIIMLNCGGSMSIEDEFALDATTFCYVIDAHRPLHHSNLLPARDQTIVFADEFMDEDELKAAAVQMADLGTTEIEHLFSAALEDEDEDDEEHDDEDLGEENQDGGRLEDSESEHEAEFEAGDNSQSGEHEQAPQAPTQPANKVAGTENHSDAANLGFSAAEQAEIDQEIEQNKLASEKRAEDGQRQEPGSTTRRARRDSGDDAKSTSTDSDAAATSKVQRKRTRSHASGDDGGALSKRSRVLRYYGGSYWGAPAAHVMLSLAQQLNKDSKLYLWLAIVGTTFHDVYRHMDVDNYHQLVMQYQERVKDRTGRAEQVLSEDSVLIPVVDQDRIEFSDEYRLMLHRHWSLKESFQFSDYVAAKLGIWRTDGESKLHTLFAKMGISLKESHQKYSFMSIKLKKELRSKIQEHTEEFDLGEDFVYGSFLYRAGYNSQMSAADAVHCVSALLDGYAASPSTVELRSRPSATLEAGTGVAAAPNPAADENDAAGASGDGGQRDEALGSAEERRERAAREALLWEESFNAAYDVLDFTVSEKNSHLLDTGLELAKALQKAIIEEGANVMADQRLQSAGDFRFCVLSGLAPKLASVFSQPQVLLRFAQFIMDANTCSGRWRGPAAKPLVIGVKGGVSQVAHFVGIPPAQLGEVRRNAFGRQFREAAKIVGATCKHSGFDNASVEIGVEDTQRFLLALHEVVSNAEMASDAAALVA